MTADQIILALALVAALVFFAWGRWRYDLVAISVLLFLVIAGVVESGRTFSGFGHPAVITVAAVLVVSRGLQNSGVVASISRGMSAIGDRPAAQVLTLTCITALCSGFMNNIGALAILMPVAVGMARNSGRSPSYLLMPIAFGSLLGGMLTLIGTPPNIIISSFRNDALGESFGMFSFTPVAAVVAAAGCLFAGMIGWKLIPKRDPAASLDAMFEIDAYTAELRVPEDSKAIGMTIGQITKQVGEDATVIGIAHADRQLVMPSRREKLSKGDILALEADPDTIEKLTSSLGLELDGDRELREQVLKTKEEIVVAEAIVTPGSTIESRTPAQLNLRTTAGLNILGVARNGKRIRKRLREINLRGGDVLLLQGNPNALQQAYDNLGLLPLAQRELTVGKPKRAILAVSIFAAGIVTTALGLLPVEVAFTTTAVLMILTKLLSLREIYHAIDWPIIILLGAMLPVGEAMQTTGAAELASTSFLAATTLLPQWGILTALMVITMLLSNIINNAAAALLMAPIAIGIAEGTQASPDPFLIGVAIAASAALLTPIGHQSNTLVMGPGGYRFADYWRLGLPLSIIVLLTAVPTILIVWPM